MKTYGYIRVSGADQNEDRQLAAMKALLIPRERLFMDKKSGKDFDRNAYQCLLNRLCPGDLLYIKSIDRLGRNYAEIQNQWRVLTKEKNVDIAVIDMPLLDTRNGKDLMGTFIADLVLQILSFIAQTERESILIRQAEGIAAAKRRGVRFGRPIKAEAEGFTELLVLWEQNPKRKISTIQAIRQSGLSRATLYRRIKALQQ